MLREILRDVRSCLLCLFFLLAHFGHTHITNSRTVITPEVFDYSVLPSAWFADVIESYHTPVGRSKQMMSCLKKDRKK